MREKQNTYLVTAGVLVFAFLFMPLSKFGLTGEVYTVLDFKIFLMDTGYKYYVGGVTSIILAALIFGAITVYRNKKWQQRLAWTALATNTFLFAFIVYKFVHWTNDPRVSLQQPSLQFGIVFPIIVEVMLIGTLQKIRRG